MLPVLTDEQIRRLDRAAPRYTSYPTVPAWREDFGEGDYLRALQRAATTPDEALSIYVDIPFCREMCTFCGCNSIVSRNEARADRYLDAVERELALVTPHLGARRSVSRIHLGGGTPTTLTLPQLERLWRLLTDRFDVRKDAEVALEIDPAVTTTEQLALLRGFGFNRMSMGVQDFDPDVQRAVNRVQSVAETRAMLEHARKIGFQSVNFDMIYGLPLQTEQSWQRTLDQVLELSPDRVAVYSFAFVPQMRPHQKRLAVLPMATGAPKLELFRKAYEAFTGAGYAAIGMDHFARPDDELAIAQKERRLTRNFQGYSVRAATDVVSFGVSAIADVQGLYAQNVQAVAKYYSMIDQGLFPVDRGISCSTDDRSRRKIINELMCNFHVDLGAADGFDVEFSELRDLEKEGFVSLAGRDVELTESGRVFVRNVASVFDSYLRKQRLRNERRGFSRTV